VAHVVSDWNLNCILIKPRPLLMDLDLNSRQVAKYYNNIESILNITLRRQPRLLSWSMTLNHNQKGTSKHSNITRLTTSW